MRHYCDTISVTLAKNLKEKGMPLGSCVYMPNGGISRKDEANLAYFDDQLVPYCTYAEVFDWLMEKDIRIYPVKIKDCSLWHTILNDTLFQTLYNTWHEAAEAAIEKALTLI